MVEGGLLVLKKKRSSVWFQRFKVGIGTNRKSKKLDHLKNQPTKGRNNNAPARFRNFTNSNSARGNRGIKNCRCNWPTTESLCRCCWCSRSTITSVTRAAKIVLMQPKTLLSLPPQSAAASVAGGTAAGAGPVHIAQPAPSE